METKERVIEEELMDDGKGHNEAEEE